jgi:hypothetical protein
VKYKGKTLEKYNEIIDYALSLSGVEQKEFVDAVEATGPHALSNIGYWSGYFSDEMAEKIQSVFRTEHPIFGKKRPTTEEALALGEKIGTKAKGTSVYN